MLTLTAISNSTASLGIPLPPMIRFPQMVDIKVDWGYDTDETIVVQELYFHLYSNLVDFYLQPNNDPITAKSNLSTSQFPYLRTKILPAVAATLPKSDMLTPERVMYVLYYMVQLLYGGSLPPSFRGWPLKDPGLYTAAIKSEASIPIGVIKNYVDPAKKPSPNANTLVLNPQQNLTSARNVATTSNSMIGVHVNYEGGLNIKTNSWLNYFDSIMSCFMSYDPSKTDNDNLPDRHGRQWCRAGMIWDIPHVYQYVEIPDRPAGTRPLTFSDLVFGLRLVLKNVITSSEPLQAITAWIYRDGLPIAVYVLDISDMSTSPVDAGSVATS